jgi:hypothetical protein
MRAQRRQPSRFSCNRVAAAVAVAMRRPLSSRRSLLPSPQQQPFSFRWRGRNDQPNSGDPLDYAGAIVVDTARGRALVTAPATKQVLAVDLESGVRSVFAQNVGGSDEPFSRPVDIVLDRAHNRALVSNQATAVSTNAIIAIDLDSGASRVLSDASTPDSADPFTLPNYLALDEIGNRLFVSDNYDRIVAVDLASGRRNVVAPFSGVGDIEFDPVGKRILVGLNGSVYAIDVATLLRSPFTTMDAFYDPWLLIDADARVFALDLNNGLTQLSPVTGEHVIISR